MKTGNMSRSHIVKTNPPIRLLNLAMVTCALLLASAHEVMALTDLERAAQQAEQIQRDRSAAEQRQLLDSDQLQRQAPDGLSVTVPELTDSLDGEACIQVDTISASGITLFEPTTIDELLHPFAGRCLGLSHLNNILKQLTFLYVEAGYITSRAYLPEQDIADGSLEIIVLEGNLAGIVMNEQPGEYQWQLATAFPNMQGKPVNLRDIEQGLDQINRLQANSATVELRAGEEPGDSLLAVAREQDKLWYLSIGMDNLGSTATGKFQTRFSLWLDDLLGLNEQWSFSYLHSMEESPLNFFTQPQSDAYTAGVSLPYGYWTFGLNGSWSEYQSNIPGLFSDIETSGSSQSINLDISRVLHRDQISKTSLAGRLTYKENENFILGSRIDISSRILSIGSLDLTHARQLYGGQLAASAGYQRGLDLFGAFDDKTAMDGSPKGQFNKAVFSLRYFRPFRVGKFIATYSGSLSGQWSPDLLFGSEQMSLGGYSTVRGLREAVLFGNRAAMTRHELALQLPPFKSAGLTKRLGQLETYIAADYGKVFTESKYQIEGGSLAGATLGLRARGGNISFDLSWSDIVASSSNLQDAVSDSGLIYATVALSF